LDFLIFYSAFVFFTFAAAFEPGPVQVRLSLITLRDGRAAGMAAALGVQAGNLPALSLVVFGFHLLLALAPALLETVRWVSIIYLGWMAISMLRGSDRQSSLRNGATQTPDGREPDELSAPLLVSFRRGFLFQITNPLPIGFFASYLQIWIRHDVNLAVSTQLICLAAALVVIFAISDFIFIFASSRVGGWLAERTGARKVLRWFCATWLGVLAMRLLSEKLR
jgi:threonine/homoserine/homoserine lactone efflux protein